MASTMHTVVERDWDLGMIEVGKSNVRHLRRGKERVDDGSPPWRNHMLRIHRSGDGEVVYRLSGRMDRESIAELESLLGAEPGGKSIVLDLKDITLAGQHGIDFLARCEAADIKLSNCPPYIREWITRQRKKEGESL
jgi:hypothetical protein